MFALIELLNKWKCADMVFIYNVPDAGRLGQKVNSGMIPAIRFKDFYLPHVGYTVRL